VSVEYIDADKDPIKANQNQVQQYGTVVFDYKGKTERVTSSEEGQLTNGLIKLITGKERKVYFLQGHGEKDTANSERAGYSAIAGRAGIGELQGRQPGAAAAADRPRRRHHRRGGRPDDRSVPAGDRGAEEVPAGRREGPAAPGSAPEGRRASR
jgi:hypothetical protein